ncbi:hypothetical protein KHQ88_03440 [Mycoplasmatota bacterium]|nr:hypothetical protein KHQ88_03440 [Mycoplasmatota bacterium]
MKKITKPIIYAMALMILGMSIALIQNTSLGMSPWDALSRNFYEGIPIQYTYLSPILSVMLIFLAYLINWKRPDLKMIVPVLVSTIIGFSIDLSLLFIPNVAGYHILINYLYLFLAMILISIALNVIIYCGYTLPALEQFIFAISNRLKISFGRAKLLGELLAFILTIIFGFIFHHQSDFFFIGQTTIIVLLFIGLMVDVFQKPTYKLLGRII